MQIYAFNAKGKLLAISEAKRHKNYFCLECQKTVRRRGGRWRQLHFYHLDPPSACYLSKKSLAHIHTQYALQKMLAPEEVWLERRFDQIGRIADVVWPAKNLIFEVQCSSISEKEIEARNRDYKQLGYSVVWILHDCRFNRFRLTPAENYLLPFPHYFTNINNMGRGLLYDQYALIQRCQRVKRSPRFPIYVKRLTCIDSKQMPRQLSQERQKWKLSFGGDLLDRSFSLHGWGTQKARVLRLVNPFRLLFHLFLEKV